MATAVNPGVYQITLTGTDQHGLSETDSVEITVLELEDGWVPRTASITEPPSDLEGVGANTVTVNLAGFARGVDGNIIAGTRYRWTAQANNGYSFEICVGSNFPGQGGGSGGPVIGIAQSCTETSAEFGLAPGTVGRTKWTVKLEAVDSQGVPVTAVREIEVTFATS